MNTKNSEALAAALKKRKGVVKMMIGCVTLFFICYTPMVLNYIAVQVLLERARIAFF
jgi:hypothetical protein